MRDEHIWRRQPKVTPTHELVVDGEVARQYTSACSANFALRRLKNSVAALGGWVDASVRRIGEGPPGAGHETAPNSVAQVGAEGTSRKSTAPRDYPRDTGEASGGGAR